LRLERVLDPEVMAFRWLAALTAAGAGGHDIAGTGSDSVSARGPLRLIRKTKRPSAEAEGLLQFRSLVTDR
jgi:hypothetical protein